MNLSQKVQGRFKTISNAVFRFWFSSIAFILATISEMIAIATYNSWEKLILTLGIAGTLGIAVQLVNERFFENRRNFQIGLYVVSLLFVIGYYIYLQYNDFFQYSVMVRSWVLFFTIFIGSCWVPSIKSNEFAFSKSFIVFIKSLFTSLFLAAVLMIGLLIIIQAINFLIMPVDTQIYGYLTALVWLGFFPIYFLSLLPHFPGKRADENEDYKRAVTVPKFLAVLLSYILVPLLGIYTLILLVYIFRNITGDFWNDNLLEPLLVSYVVTGWFVLFLIDSLANKIVTMFKKYFPSLLFIVTGLQGAASLVKVARLGMTDVRYFILLFVVFSLISSIIYLFFHQKVAFIPGLLVGLSVISILPFIDAVSIGTRSQVKQMENVLQQNDMVQDHQIQPNDSIPTDQKRKLAHSYQYLSKVDQLQQVSNLSEQKVRESDFTEIFGFEINSLENSGDTINGNNQAESFSIDVREDDPIQIEVDDGGLVLPLHVTAGEFIQNEAKNRMTVSYRNKQYHLIWDENGEEKTDLILEDDTGKQLVRYDLQFLRELAASRSAASNSELLPVEDLTFSERFNGGELQIYVTHLYVEEGQNIDADFYLQISLD
ncbi:DUF4153 domain-containing protein [Tetragenococcus solitarius]|uniref:DUF4153 domain-containing protein n=1 Tax=Tetragenococcus solitarius TaxID=71453 RepID=A0ABN3Y2C1_9ENTE|nr:DUF4153 domain-containing protein [Tetragenococcus solitarius]